jgi:hypothetical protein
MWSQFFELFVILIPIPIRGSYPTGFTGRRIPKVPKLEKTKNGTRCKVHGARERGPDQDMEQDSNRAKLSQETGEHSLELLDVFQAIV